MARTNGPFGPPGARAPLRRHPASEIAGQPTGQWPPSQAFPDHGNVPQAGQGYHFPPPEQEPNYGYGQQVLAPQQWGQQGDPRAYEVGNYLPAAQPYADPGPFQQTSHQQQAYAETDADYGEEYLEDEEPRRGRRWIFIVAALVGAIGVGGALAYTYRSLIAPSSGRVPLVKSDAKVKVKPEHPGGKEFAGADRKLPNRLGEGTGSPKAPETEDDPPGEEKNLGPRSVKTIPIGSQPAQVAPPVMVPGITLQNVPPPRAEPPPQAAPKTAQPPPGRVTIGQPPPAEADDSLPAPPPVKRPPAAQSPPQVVARAAPPKAREIPPAPSSGMGYVTVVASKKSSVEALKVYADLQQKHGDLLANRTPAVQESDQTARGLGIMYRLVVGPPGSRESATDLCNQLKATGQDCWVMAY